MLDLEWVPGESLPLATSYGWKTDRLSEIRRLSIPPKIKRTKPLRLRVAGYYEMRKEEADDEESPPQLVEDYQYFMTIEGLLEHLLASKRRGMWFFAHAGGLADMQFVLDEILLQIKNDLKGVKETIREATPEEKKFGAKLTSEVVTKNIRVRASFSGSSAIIVHVIKGKNAWHFVDSYWLLRDKLENIGKAIGIMKGAKEKRMSQAEARDFYTNAPIDELIAYNKVDCEILWKAIKQFEDEILSLGGQLQQTIASTGMSLFRRVYMKRIIYTSERVNSIAEKSYFASRVEVIARHATDFLTFDLNSSFPYAMTFPLPAGLSAVSRRLPTSDDESKIYMADVTLEVPEMVIPPVPYRKENRVFFPIGMWRSWLTSVDIRLAQQEGVKIHKVHEVLHFDPFLDLKGYVDDIYAKRAAATSDMRKLVLKYLLNVLYGKYAESMLKQEMLINPDDPSEKGLTMMQPGIWMREKNVPIVHRHVPISTYITSIARRTLYKYMKMSYTQGEEVYYVDTDSVSTRANLPTDEKTLGAMKLEKKTIRGEFIAPKIYMGEGWRLGKNGTWEEDVSYWAKAKGFSLDRISVPGVDDTSKKATFEKLARVARGDRVSVQRMIRLRELYSTNVDGQYLTSPIETLVIKALTFEMLSKRFHYPDGETRPWSVEELNSGDIYPRGFNFEAAVSSRFDDGLRDMLQRAVV